jgi:hypothetical protein
MPSGKTQKLLSTDDEQPEAEVKEQQSNCHTDANPFALSH